MHASFTTLRPTNQVASQRLQGPPFLPPSLPPLPGGDDPWVVFGGGVQVVVVRGQTRGLELPGLLGVEHAQGGAHLQAHAVHLSIHKGDRMNT